MTSEKLLRRIVLGAIEGKCMDGSIPEKGTEPRFRDLDSVIALPLTSDLTFGILVTSLKLGGDRINLLYLD